MKKQLVYIATLCLLAIFQANAATITVESTVDSATPINGRHTLRSAIAAANSGDIIMFSTITDGTPIVLSLGQISIQKDLAIRGNGINNTILDGNQTNRIFVIGSTGAEYFVSLTKLTLQNGSTTSSGFNGGGAIQARGSLYMRDCKFYKNTSPNGSGGAFSLANLSGHQPNTFINVDFVENDGQTSAITIGNMGGAVTNFERCSFVGNTSQMHGGVFTAGFYNTTNFINCNFRNNTGVEGAALNLAGNVKIVNNVFVGNTATGSGGAISNSGSGALDLSIINSTIAGNTAASFAGGIQQRNTGYAATLHLYNNIIAHNTSTLAATQSFFQNDIFIGSGTCTLYGGNFIGEASGLTANTTDMIGTNTAPIDPLFVDLANGDVHLTPCSPAINLSTSIQTETFVNYDVNGDGSISGNIGVDYDENPRTVSANTDAGAYEYQGTIYSAPVPAFHYNGNTFCQNSGSALPTAFNPGGTYAAVGSNATDVIIDAATGAIDLNDTPAGTYTIQYSVTDCNGGTNSHTETITINPSPVNIINVTICAGESYTLGCDTYTQSGTYTHTTTTPQGCPSTTTLNLTVADPIQITISQQMTQVGAVSKLIATVTPAVPLGGYTYSWMLEGQEVSVSNIVSSPCADKVYTLTVTNTATGCTETVTYSFANQWNRCKETIDPDLGFGKSSTKRTTAENNTNTIYPNPNNGNFTLQSNGSPIVRYEVYNSKGKVIQNKTVNESKRQNVNLANAPAGMYMVRIYTKSNQVVFKRVVIK